MPAADSAAWRSSCQRIFLSPFAAGPSPQPSAFGPAHLVHRLIQMHRDVEAVQHVQRLAGFGGDDLQIRLPHVAANEAQPCTTSGPSAARPRRRWPACAVAHPQQAPAMTVDLINDRQETIRPLARPQ